MLKIVKIGLSEESESIRFTKDIFIFSYLCGGINFTDIANLEPINIIENRLQYVRQKTGKEISLRLSQEASQILCSYSKLSEIRGFLFPILKKQAHITAIQKQNRIRKILGKIDKDLKDIAKKCQININLTTYVARHTFARTLNATEGVYNLLDLSNGISTLIATGDMQPGTVSQIRLILGSNNTVTVGGVYPLFLNFTPKIKTDVGFQR